MTIRFVFIIACMLSVVSVVGQKLPLVSAHRGANREAPENTLAAFAKAIEQGADYLEVDVRTTSDGTQICMHDRSLKRTTGIDADVRSTSLETIRQASAGKGFEGSQAIEKVPTLEELCVLVNQSNHDRETTVKLYVDCKDIDAGEVIHILNKNQLLDSAVFYGDVAVLKELRKFHDAVRLMPAYPGSKRADSMARKLHVYAFDMNWQEIDADDIKACHSKKIKVFCDLLDAGDMPAEYQRAIQLGIDLIQTDNVPAVKKALSDFKNQR